eukprot:169943-Prymnesium_polylepis.1
MSSSVVWRRWVGRGCGRGLVYVTMRQWPTRFVRIHDAATRGCAWVLLLWWWWWWECGIQLGFQPVCRVRVVVASFAAPPSVPIVLLIRHYVVTFAPSAPRRGGSHHTSHPPPCGRPPRSPPMCGAGPAIPCCRVLSSHVSEIRAWSVGGDVSGHCAPVWYYSATYTHTRGSRSI